MGLGAVTTTFGGTQIGGLGGGTTENDFSEGKTQNAATQGGGAAGGGSEVAFGVNTSGIGSTANTYITEASAPAVAALADVADTALSNAATESVGAFQLAQGTTSKSLDVAKQGTQSQLQQAGGIIVPIVIAVAVVAGVFYWSRK